MIKRILLNQASTFQRFRQAVFGASTDGGPIGSGCEFRPANIDTFEQLEAEAEHVRSMVVTLLDLRQREASIEDALSMGEQSTMLFIFTTVTVLFVSLPSRQRPAPIDANDSGSPVLCLRPPCHAHHRLSRDLVRLAADRGIR
jgi:hypothetical protein